MKKIKRSILCHTSQSKKDDYWKVATTSENYKVVSVFGESSFRGVMGVMNSRAWMSTYCRVKRNMRFLNRQGKRKEHWNLKWQGEEGERVGEWHDSTLCHLYYRPLSQREAGCAVVSTGFGARLPAFVAQLPHHLLTVSTWASYLTSLSLVSSSGKCSCNHSLDSCEGLEEHVISTQ